MWKSEAKTEKKALKRLGFHNELKLNLIETDKPKVF